MRPAPWPREGTEARAHGEGHKASKTPGSHEHPDFPTLAPWPSRVFWSQQDASALWFQDDGPGQCSRGREDGQRGRADASVLTPRRSPVLSVPPVHPAQALVAACARWSAACPPPAISSPVPDSLTAQERYLETGSRSKERAESFFHLSGMV